MNWLANVTEPLRRMFMDKDGGLDEIVVAICTLVISGLVLEFRTYWSPGAGVPPFSLKDFGEGMVMMAAGAGAWQKLRAWSRSDRDGSAAPGPGGAP